MNLINLSIQILWLVLGVILLCGIIWLALYAVRQFLPIPDVVERVIWLVVLILVLIGVLTMIAGGGAGLRSPFRSELSTPSYSAVQSTSDNAGGSVTNAVGQRAERWQALDAASGRWKAAAARMS